MRLMPTTQNIGKVIVMAGIFGSFGCGKSPEKQYEVADIYRGLRQNILNLDPKTIGLSSSSPNKIWAVLMETGYPEAVVTLVTIADGTVSLYFSNGGGIIGLGPHDGPRKACFDLLAGSSKFLTYASPTKEFPLPKPGYTRFYFMTYNGAFTTESKENDLGNNRLPLSPLFHKAHEVITQARLVDEKLEEPARKMIHAAATDNIRELQSLIKSGISVDVADKTGLTSLMAASHSGKPQTLEFLLNSGAQIDMVDSSGYTALMFACNAGQKESVRLLVEKGADINHQDKDASTPIMFAAQHAHNDIARLLLAHGADPKFKGKHGLSAIGFAHQNGHYETERILTR